MEIKRKTVSKKVWCVGQSTHNPLRFAIFEGGQAGRLTPTRKTTHKPISELSVVPVCYAVQTTIGILRITATTNHATVRHDLVARGHNSLAEHNWVLPHTKPRGTGPSSQRRITISMGFYHGLYHGFYHGLYHGFYDGLYHVLSMFFTCFTMVFTMFYVFQVWYRFMVFHGKHIWKLWSDALNIFELVLRMFLLIMFIDLIWFDHLGMEIQKYVNNSQYLTVHRGVFNMSGSLFLVWSISFLNWIYQ